MQTQALIDRDAQAYNEASAVAGARRALGAPRRRQAGRHRGARGPTTASGSWRRRFCRRPTSRWRSPTPPREIAQLAAQVARECPKAMRPDALTAVALAEAAAYASAGLVAVNRKLADDDPRRASALEAAQAAQSARERAG